MFMCLISVLVFVSVFMFLRFRISIVLDCLDQFGKKKKKKKKKIVCLASCDMHLAYR